MEAASCTGTRVPVSTSQPDRGRSKRPALFAFHELAEIEESFPPCLELPLSLELRPCSIGIESTLEAEVVQKGGRSRSALSSAKYMLFMYTKTVLHVRKLLARFNSGVLRMRCFALHA